MIEIKKKIDFLEINLLKSYNEENWYNYYEFLESDENLKLLFEIYEEIKNLESINYKKIIKKILNFYDKDDIKNFNFIFCIIILKIFSKNSIYSSKNDKIKSIYDYSNSISREINKMLIWVEFKNNFDFKIEEDEIWRLTMDLIIFMIEKKKINKEDFISKNMKKNKFIYIKNIIKNNKIILANENYVKYDKNNNLYILSTHFSLTQKVFKKNPKSGYKFKTNINSKFIENMLDNWVYINKEMLEIIYTKNIEENNYISEKLEYENIELNNKLIEFIKKKDVSSIRLISQKISKIQNIIRIKNILNLDLSRKIYIPFTLDFRGRVYLESEISPTFYKEIRFCINKGVYNKVECKEHIYNNLINTELYKYIEKIKNITNINLINKSKDVNIAIIWLLISAGEINKSKMNKEIKIDEFIDEGIVLLNQEMLDTNLDFYDRIRLIQIKKILREIEEDIYVKWLISKDSTASVYQHLIKTCGYKNNDSLKKCNLNSFDTWYDTYKFIIEEFKKEIKTVILDKNKFENIFNRKNLKSTIMTENYSASLETCKKYFLSTIYIDKYNEQEKEEIMLIFKKFYKFLSESNIFFDQNISCILEYFKKEDYIMYINNDDYDIVFLKYYKGEKRQKELVINKKRYTYQQYKITEKYDNPKIKLSIKANYIHALDSSLSRWYLSKVKTVAIHDSFFIDYINTTYMVSLINEGMRIGFHHINKTNTEIIFSIFIII